MDSSKHDPIAARRWTAVAGPLHTVAVLVILAVWTWWRSSRADELSLAAHPNRILSYAAGLVFEWSLVLFIVAGVPRTRAALGILFGGRWHSARGVLRDTGIAAAFWLLSYAVLWGLAVLLQVAAHSPSLRYMLPDRGLELAWWIALSVTAGICEEMIFRGYLQRQFLALTNSAPVAILLSGAIFGSAHAYQGFRMVLLIGVFGCLFGALAHWRRTVRPGMIAHAWQDSLNGVLAALAK